jgi:hypothetical protein
VPHRRPEITIEADWKGRNLNEDDLGSQTRQIVAFIEKAQRSIDVSPTVIALSLSAHNKLSSTY